MKSITRTIGATVACLTLSLFTLSAAIDVVPSNTSLTVAGQGVRVAEALPRVQLLVGAERTLLDWKPDKPGKIHQTAETTPLGKADVTVVTWQHPDGYTLKWNVARLRDREGCTLQCELENRSGADIRIRRFFVLDAQPGSLTLEGNSAEWMTSSRYLKYARYYDTVADLVERGQFTQDQSKNAKTTRYVPYEDDFALYTDHGDRGLSISPVGDLAWVWAHLSVPKEGGLGLDVTSEMTGVLVESGESRKSERVLVLLESWRDSSLAMVKWLRHTFEPRDTPPVYGWCSWYCAGGHVRQDHCFDTAEFVRTRRDRYPFETLQVDEGWSIGRHLWHANKKFDRGMVDLATAFEEAESLPGVWLCPATPNSERIVDGELVPIGGKGGKAVRSFDESWYVGYSLGNPVIGNLDPSSPGAREFMTGELRRLYDQGYRYFKTDFSRVGEMESGYRDPRKTLFELQRMLYGLWRDAIGEDSYLLACNGGMTRAVLGLADATRIGTDSNQKWAFCYQPNKYGKPDNVHGSWFPILQLGCASFYTHLMACDPDVARVDDVGNALLDPRFKGTNKKSPHYQSMETVQTFNGILGLYGGTMMVSDLIYEPHYRQDNRLRMLEIMHPVTPDKGYNFSGGYDILNTQFGFKAERSWGNWISMVVWNPDHQSASDLRMDRAPVKNIGEKFHLWSFWEEKYLGVQDATHVFSSVPRYHSRLLRLTPLSPKDDPVLIGSTLHMSMGSAELKDVDANSKGITVELVPTAGALEGQLVFHSRKPLKLGRVQGCEAFVMKAASDVYSVVITRRERHTRQQVSLRVTSGEPPDLDAVKQDPGFRKRWAAGSMLPTSK